MRTAFIGSRYDYLAADRVCGHGFWFVTILTTVVCLATITFFDVAEAQPKTAPDPLFDRGMALVSHNCGRCHAVESKGESTHPAAPPFRNLLQRYPIDALEEGFIDEIYSQHPDMPVFKVTPEQLDAILYYIAVIQKN